MFPSRRSCTPGLDGWDGPPWVTEEGERGSLGLVVLGVAAAALAGDLGGVPPLLRRGGQGGVRAAQRQPVLQLVGRAQDAQRVLRQLLRPALRGGAQIRSFVVADIWMVCGLLQTSVYSIKYSLV